jgi:hypothetical protein
MRPQQYNSIRFPAVLLNHHLFLLESLKIASVCLLFGSPYPDESSPCRRNRSMFQRLSAQSVSACYRGVAEPALRDEFFGASISEISILSF